MMDTKISPKAYPRHMLLLYDGHCLLCNAFIRHVLKRDRQDIIRAAALQDYQAMNHRVAIDETVDSVILILDSRVMYKSDAALATKGFISRYFSWFYNGLRIIPRFIRDTVYDIIARNRYNWFGKSDECLLPEPSLRAKYVIGKEALSEYLGILHAHTDGS